MLSKKIIGSTLILAFALSCGAVFSSGNLINKSFSIGSNEPVTGTMTFSRNTLSDQKKCPKKSLGNNLYSIKASTYNIYMIVKSEYGIDTYDVGTFKNEIGEIYFSTNEDGTDVFRFQNIAKISLIYSGALNYTNITTTRFGQDTTIRKTIYSGGYTMNQSFSTSPNYISLNVEKTTSVVNLAKVVITYSCKSGDPGYVPTDLNVIDPKIEYDYGEDFVTPTKIEATYTDGNNYDVTNKVDVDSGSFNKNIPGTYEIFLTYFDFVPVYDSYFVTVNAPSLLSINIVEAKTIFIKDVNDFEKPTLINGTYSDGTTHDITNLVIVDDSAFNKTVVGTYPIYVRLDDIEVSYDVSVIEDGKILDSISLSGNYPTEFNVGDRFSYDGLVVTAHYSDSSFKEVTTYTVSEPDMSTPGEKEIMISYEENNVTVYKSYNIIVKKAQVSILKYSLKVTGAPNSHILSLELNTNDHTGVYSVTRTNSFGTSVVGVDTFNFTWSQNGDNVSFVWVSQICESSLSNHGYGTFYIFEEWGGHNPVSGSKFDGDNFFLKAIWRDDKRTSATYTLIPVVEA